jgi:hypothetical protein
MHDGAALLERDFVHERSHDVNSTPMFAVQAICSGRIRYCAAVKSLSLIPNTDADFSV